MVSSTQPACFTSKGGFIMVLKLDKIKLLGLTSCIEMDSQFNQLLFATDMLFDAHSKRHDPTCLPDTRVELLNVGKFFTTIAVQLVKKSPSLR
jgi:hypothetical protein